MGNGNLLVDDTVFTLVLLRHGESVWNCENRFTGWTDVELSAAGRAEAQRAGRLLSASGFTFDLAFSSVLRRSTETLDILLSELEQHSLRGAHTKLERRYHWQLNERHYGALQGQNKTEVLRYYDPAHVHQWRRGSFARPPEISMQDERFPGNDPLYAGVPLNELPRTESIRDTQRRVLPFWRECVLPEVANGRQVLVVAHGHTIRALVRDMYALPESEFALLKIPNASPMLLHLDARLRPVHRWRFVKEVSNAG
ncbi:MAG: 2,3-bisphosphoglycerate-dependent phosphoglycerate mutase [Spirochaetaceae bacterium]|nr:MAG: 2,3-bisphosphoglycerate-dependent phosphoglycerate mutase [Spirochaetaceae bacterium]